MFDSLEIAHYFSEKVRTNKFEYVHSMHVLFALSIFYNYLTTYFFEKMCANSASLQTVPIAEIKRNTFIMWPSQTMGKDISERQ